MSKTARFPTMEQRVCELVECARDQRLPVDGYKISFAGIISNHR